MSSSGSSSEHTPVDVRRTRRFPALGTCAARLSADWDDAEAGDFDCDLLFSLAGDLAFAGDLALAGDFPFVFSGVV